jgi:predicted enzyme related to lactoylglutathione lyase
MSSAPTAAVITGVDFVSVPTRDLERSVAFYGQTLGLERSAYRPDRNHAEFETGTVTLNVLDPERMGVGSFTPNANLIALHVDDVEQARATLTERGVAFAGDTFDTGVCHMAFFADPDGNARVGHEAVGVEPARVDAERAGQQLAAALRELLEQTLQRRAALARDGHGVARLGQADRFLGQEDRHLATALERGARHQEGDGHAL